VAFPRGRTCRTSPAGLKSGNPAFRSGGNVGQQINTMIAVDAQRASLPRGERQERAHRADLHLASHRPQGLDGRPGAAEWHMHELRPCLRREQNAFEVHAAADSRRAEIELAGVLPGERDELFAASRRQLALMTSKVGDSATSESARSRGRGSYGSWCERPLITPTRPDPRAACTHPASR